MRHRTSSFACFRPAGAVRRDLHSLRLCAVYLETKVHARQGPTPETVVSDDLSSSLHTQKAPTSNYYTNTRVYMRLEYSHVQFVLFFWGLTGLASSISATPDRCLAGLILIRCCVLREPLSLGSAVGDGSLCLTLAKGACVCQYTKARKIESGNGFSYLSRDPPAATSRGGLPCLSSTQAMLLATYAWFSCRGGHRTDG